MMMRVVMKVRRMKVRRVRTKHIKTEYIFYWFWVLFGCNE